MLLLLIVMLLAAAAAIWAPDTGPGASLRQALVLGPARRLQEKPLTLIARVIAWLILVMVVLSAPQLAALAGLADVGAMLELAAALAVLGLSQTVRLAGQAASAAVGALRPRLPGRKARPRSARPGRRRPGPRSADDPWPSALGQLA
jgi:hypothetical protein